jgi:hypothetical protein
LRLSRQQQDFYIATPANAKMLEKSLSSFLHASDGMLVAYGFSGPVVDTSTTLLP